MRTTISQTLTLAAIVGMATPMLGVSSSYGDTVNITATSAPSARGEFMPQNVIAVWIEDSAGNFVKTIRRQSEERTQYLLGWLAKAGPNDVDAVTAASRIDHTMPITATWDGKDRAGVAVPNGMYKVRLEMADSNVVSVAENNEGTFQFDKNGTSSTSPPANSGGFTNVTIEYVVAANPADCNNGMVDSGETCDGDCPTSCLKPADACVESKLAGSAATCDAKCEESTITACKGGDGCCAAGCNSASDSDCKAAPNPQPPAAADGSNQVVEGGCQTGNSGAGAMLALTAVGLLILRRRQS